MNYNANDSKHPEPEPRSTESGRIIPIMPPADHLGDRSRGGTFTSNLRLTWPVAAGYIPMGIAFGIVAASQQLPLWWIITTSLFVYSGALQFAAVTLVISAAGLPQIALAAIFLSVRHCFYGLSYPLHLVAPGWRRVYGIHTITDETYALISAQPPARLDGKTVLGAGALNQVYWVAGAALGGVTMDLLPFDATFMGFSLTALFIILATESYRANPSVAVVVAAFASAGVGVAVGKRFMLLTALCLFSVYALGRALRRTRGREADTSVSPPAPPHLDTSDRPDNFSASASPTSTVADSSAVGAPPRSSASAIAGESAGGGEPNNCGDVPESGEAR